MGFSLTGSAGAVVDSVSGFSRVGGSSVSTGVSSMGLATIGSAIGLGSSFAAGFWGVLSVFRAGLM